MNNSAAFTHPVASTGTDVSFAKLTVDDIFLDLLPSMVKQEKARKIENLKAAGAPPESVIAELEEFDAANDDPAMSDLITRTDKQAGKLAVVQHAYRKANPDAKERLSLTPRELFDVLNKLLEPLGVQYQIVTPDAPKPIAPADGPQPLQGYGSNAPGGDPLNPPKAYGQA